MAKSIESVPEDPVPIRRWISSIKIITWSEFCSISCKIALIRFSNSPLKEAPARIKVRSNSKICLFFKLSGTWFAIIFRAIPSTIAVLPTPGSPTRTGLFFVFRDKILIILLISSSRPITGSILFSFANFVKFLAYFSRFSSLCFIFFLFNFLFFLTK
ncbi:hypothetical protein MHL_2875 [Mesomycoplasma hyopneumoniae 7422]|nr:hypothetical protein MHL_2875 [Mesomycoplasma hyopneumoniae 7422]